MKTLVYVPSTIETVDYALYNWLEGLNIKTRTNSGVRVVPLVWLSSERVFQVKNDKDLREVDSNSIILPIITIERTSMSKTPAGERAFPGNVFPVNDHRKGAVTIYKKIVQDKTANFANADSKRVYGQNNFPFDNKKVVNKAISIPYPVFMNMNYTIKIRTDYLQQMNEATTPFYRYTSGINQFIVKRDGHRYEAFLDDDFPIESNASGLGEEEKKFEATISIKVLGYLSSDDTNQESPEVVVRENAVQVRMQRERSALDNESF